MATASATSPVPIHRTLADLLTSLGDISAARVRLRPFPGTATPSDVIAIHDRENRLCELVDGTLVDKAMGFDEAIYAVLLGAAFVDFLKSHDLGKVVGGDGMMRIFPSVVRIPDVAFISWARFPRRRRGEIPRVVPDLVVEILSAGNTPKEMARKLDEYFGAGVRLVWYVNPKSRTVRVYTAGDRSVLLREDGTLDGGDVLPGFSFSIRQWFEEAEHTTAKPTRGK